MPKLKITDPQSRTTVLDIQGNQLFIGRSSDCHVQLFHQGISRIHARLFKKRRQWHLQDLGSTHGTYFGGEPLDDSVEIQMGDEFTLAHGESTFLIQIYQEEEPMVPLERPPDTQQTVYQDAASILKAAMTIPRGSGLKNYAYRLKEIRDAAETFSSAQSLEQLKVQLMDRLFTLFRPTGAAIYLKDDSGQYRPVAYQPSGKLPPLSTTLVREITSTGLALCSPDIQNDPRFYDSQSVMTIRYRALMASPLLEGGEIHGIATVYATHQDAAFDEDEMKLLVGLCSVAALRLRNIQLTDQVTRHLRETNRDLEQKVAERTLSLEKKNEELLAKNREILAAQESLVLQEKMASLGILTAGVAHEFNNPNNVINSNAQLLVTALNNFKQLLFGLMEEEDQQVSNLFNDHFSRLNRHVELVSESSDRLRAIIKDLHLITRMDEADVKLIDIVESLRATANLLRSRYPRVAFQWSGEQRLEIECRPAEISQVFMNLLDNGCRAMENAMDEEEEAREFKITIQHCNDNALVTFTDHGTGMSKEVADKVFEPFFTTRPPGMGTGLGLYTSFNVVRKHGGLLAVTSELNKGSTFELTLPLKKGKDLL